MLVLATLLVVCLTLELGMARLGGADLSSAWAAFTHTQWELASLRLNINTEAGRHKEAESEKSEYSAGNIRIMKLLDKITRFNIRAKFVPLNILFSNKLTQG